MSVYKRGSKTKNILIGLCLSSAIGCSHMAIAAPPNNNAPSRSQAELPALINDGFDAPSRLKFDWPMINIGTGQYEDGPTGLTILKFGRKVHAAVDARGGGPGTINPEFINMGYTHPELDAIVLAGGSWYGLEAATGAMTALLDDRHSSGHWANVGFATGSIIYDLGGRRLNEIYPDKRLAQLVLRSAKTGIFPRGAYGAGRSAVNGGIFGCNAKSGQGAAFRQIGEVKIAVFTVVNALGVVTDREGQVVNCFKGQDWPDNLQTSDLMRGAPDSLRSNWKNAEAEPFEKKNTTISVVVTNVSLSHAELKRLAAQVHTSMGRGIQPFATEFDGDVLYAVSTSELDESIGVSIPSMELGIVASELMWDAILSTTPHAQPAHITRGSNVEVDEKHLKKLIGTYRFSDIVDLTISYNDGKLIASATGERDVFSIKKDLPQHLIPVSTNYFTIEKNRYPFSVKFEDEQVILNPGRWQQIGKLISDK